MSFLRVREEEKWEMGKQGNSVPLKCIEKQSRAPRMKDINSTFYIVIEMPHK
jgi:hypothetical protein